MRYIYQGVAKDGNGKVLQGATVSVYLAGTVTAADVYAAESGGVAVNSVLTDSSDGSFLFWVDLLDYRSAQEFKIVISKTNFRSKTFDDIRIFPNFTGSIADYGNDLALAILEIGSTVTTLFVDSGVIVAEGTTVTTPTTLSLDVPKGGSFDGVSGGGTETIVINGPISAGHYQIFGSNLALGGSPLIDEMYAEWTGGKADESTDSGAFINKLLTAWGATVGLPLLSGTYMIEESIIIDDFFHVYGQGANNTWLKLKDSANVNVVETVNFAALEAAPTGGIQLPIDFQLHDFGVDGNKLNNTSGKGFAIHAGNYRAENLNVWNCIETNFYSNGTRVPGTNYPESTDRDAMNANAVLYNIQSLRSEEEGMYYKGPNDAWLDMIIPSVNEGYGFRSTAVISIGYMHAYSNDLANLYVESGTIRASEIEARDGLVEGVIISGFCFIDQLYVNNNNRDGGNETAVDIIGGQGNIGKMVVVGQGLAETLFSVASNEWSIAYAELDLNNGTGEGISLTTGNSSILSLYIHNSAASDTSVSVTSGTFLTNIESIILEDAAGIVVAGGNNMIGEVIINGNKTTNSEIMLVSSGRNQIGNLLILNPTGDQDGLNVTGEFNIVNSARFEGVTGTPIDVTGTGSIVGIVSGGDETISTTGQVLSLAVPTILNSASGNLTGTMPNGLYNGQTKLISMENAGGNQFDISITSHQTSSPEVARFDSATDMLLLQWVEGGASDRWVTVVATCSFP